MTWLISCRGHGNAVLEHTISFGITVDQILLLLSEAWEI